MLCHLLPFYNLTNIELVKVLETPKNRLKQILSESNFKSFVTASINRNIINPIDCNYYDEHELNEVFKKTNCAISVLNLNIRSLDKHIGDLMALLLNVDHIFDIIILTEIGRKNIENRVSTVRDRYNMEYVTPESNNFGGACIMIRKELEYKVRKDLQLACKNVEDIWIETHIKDQTVIVGSVYRHPGGNIADFRTKLERSLDTIQKEAGRAFIGGDFNIDGCKVHKNSATADFYNSVLTQNYLPMITVPTRITEYSMTLIDNIFMKIGANNIDDDVISGNVYSDISDHLPNFVLIKCKHVFHPPKEVRPNIRIFSDKNKAKFMSLLSETNWADLYETEDPNKMINILKNRYSEIYNKSFPLTKLSRQRLKDKIWMTASIRKCIMKKNRLYKQYINNPTEKHKEMYKKYKNQLSAILREAESLHYRQKIDEKKKNAKGFWEIFGPIIAPHKARKTKPIKEIKSRGRHLTHDKEIADELNYYFANVGASMSKNIISHNDYKSYLSLHQPNSIYINPTSPSEISLIISQMKNNKSPGDDMISNNLIKYCNRVFSDIISHIANCVIKTSIYPDSLKLGKVIPIFKNGNSEDPSNYRPICLLSAINKIVEKVLYKRLYGFFEKHGLIFNYQFGFRQAYSTTLLWHGGRRYGYGWQ